jgi:hypothetical protein
MMKECSLLNDSFVPALPAYEYGGHIISAWARPEFANGSASVGVVYEQDQFGSIIQVQRIEGELFESKEQADGTGWSYARNGLISRTTQKEKRKNAQQYVSHRPNHDRCDIKK